MLETARKTFKSRQRGGNLDPSGIHSWLIFLPSSFSSYKTQEQTWNTESSRQSCSVPRDVKGALVALRVLDLLFPVTAAIPQHQQPATVPSYQPERKKNYSDLGILAISTSICSDSNQQWLQLLNNPPQILDLIIQGSFYPLSAKADTLIQPRHWIQLIAHLPFPLTSPEVICQRTHR